MRRPLVALLALLLPALPAAAQDVQIGSLTVEQPWTRATIGNIRIVPGFLTVTNGGGAADRLVGAGSLRAVEVELHETSGSMMREVDGFDIPAGGTLVLAPGGNHLMIGPLDGPLAEGDSLLLTLEFEQAGTLEVEMQVEAADARQPSN